MTQGPSAAKFIAAYQTHARTLLGYAIRRTATHADAVDVVAETMLVAWRRIDLVPDEPETILWLYGVARNVISNADRTHRRQDRLTEKLRSQLDQVVDDPPATDPALADQVIAAMNLLRPVEREVLILTAAEQLSPNEIAIVLGMNQRTVRTHLLRARKKMRSTLAAESSGESNDSAKRHNEAGHEQAERTTLRFHRTQGAQQ